MSYTGNILKETMENTFFRKVLYTGAKSQLVVMDIKPGEDIGEETHAHVDQTLFNLSGVGKVVLDGIENAFNAGDAVLVHAGTKHNFINTGSESLKIYTLYAPANHIDGRVHKTKADAVADVEDEAFGEKIQ
ncbi:MAG: cupin domain-containing protein [Minisyncoccota bacterium]